MGDNLQRTPILIGIAGGTGSGKTTVSQKLKAAVGPNQIAYLQHDSYYRDQSHLPPEQRARVNYDHPDSLDTRLLVEHLHMLRQGRPIEMPLYDFTQHARLRETRRMLPTRIVLVEGILIFVEKELRELLDMRIFVDTDADIRFIRRLRRDMIERGRSLDSIEKQYMATVRPMHMEFVEPSKRYADVIIPQGGHNVVAIDMLLTLIRSLAR